MVAAPPAAVSFTREDLAYLVYIAGVDVARIAEARAAYSKHSYQQALSVHAKLKRLQGRARPRRAVVPGSPKTALKHRWVRFTI
jgi:hypothetical protein